MRFLHKFIFFIFILTFYSCATFQKLPNSIEESSKLIGIYSNDCDSATLNISYRPKFWEQIDNKYQNKINGLLVKIEITKDNKLMAKLLNNDKIIAEKILNGQFNTNQCYYLNRKFYIVPILPILWWYNDEKWRLYFSNNLLVLDKAYDTGGAVVIMAGGTRGDKQYYYKKLQ